MNIIVVVILVVLVLGLVGVNPHWSYAASYGWGPSGVFGAVLLILLILLLLGKL